MRSPSARRIASKSARRIDVVSVVMARQYGLEGAAGHLRSAAECEEICDSGGTGTTAGGGNRTHTDLLGPSDFKSDASASSATPAGSILLRLHHVDAVPVGGWM